MFTGADHPRIERIVSFLELREGQKVADIGSGKMDKIVSIACRFPETNFTLQDISSKSCNHRRLRRKIRQAGCAAGSDKFTIRYGDTLSTGLEAAHYDHVLLMATMHEFTYMHEMLQDIKRILKKDGFLYIQEDLTEDRATMYGPCKKQYFRASEFYALLKKENITIIDRKTIYKDHGLENILFKCVFGSAPPAKD